MKIFNFQIVVDSIVRVLSTILILGEEVVGFKVDSRQLYREVGAGMCPLLRKMRS